VAVRGLGRLEYWPAAARVARLLRDPVWVVRREAALTLRALGATGTLLLRRALSDDDGFARAVARQVLDLPDRRPDLVA
jgi:HEAT repeat protein